MKAMGLAVSGTDCLLKYRLNYALTISDSGALKPAAVPVSSSSFVLQGMDGLCQLSQSTRLDRVFSPLEVYDCALGNSGLASETSSRKFLCLCPDLIEILCVDYSLVLAASLVRRV
jgi:hypothetical protein